MLFLKKGTAVHSRIGSRRFFPPVSLEIPSLKLYQCCHRLYQNVNALPPLRIHRQKANPTTSTIPTHKSAGTESLGSRRPQVPILSIVGASLDRGPPSKRRSFREPKKFVQTPAYSLNHPKSTALLVNLIKSSESSRGTSESHTKAAGACGI